MKRSSNGAAKVTISSRSSSKGVVAAEEDKEGGSKADWGNQ